MSSRFSRIFVVGANSGIVREMLSHWAAPGTRLHLTVRDPAAGEALVQELRARGASADFALLDIADESSHQRAIDAAHQALQGFDLVLLAPGLFDGRDDECLDFAFQERIWHVNFYAVASLFTRAAGYMVGQGSGTLAVFGSVAGDRVKSRNFSYGVAKAALEAFASGQRAFLHRYGLAVCLIKPGTTDTAMVRRRQVSSRLMSSPGAVARRVAKALEHGRDVVYAPWYWRWLMAGVCALPEWLFKRLRL